LKNDIGEMNDLADLEKPRAEAMLGELDKWREAIKAPIPILK